MALKKVLYEPYKPIQYVYFIDCGVVSLVSIMEDGATVEVGTIGNEGMVGLPLFLGAGTTPHQTFVQVPGTATRIQAEVFKRVVSPNSFLHSLLQQYTQALFNQISQSAACNRLHSIEERCCRWLLMTHDRVESDQFELIQEFLAQMLGVRRAGVSVVAAMLQQAGLIRYSRGKMNILDRAGLEAGSCECYAIVKREFDRLG